MSSTLHRRPLTPALLAGFFLFGTAMAALAGLSLAWPEGSVAAIWQAKPSEFAQLRALGAAVPIGFFILSVAMALTAYGTWIRRRWGWMLAVIIFAANGISDAARALISGAWSGLIGAAVVAAILWWLLRRDVRARFDRRD